MSDGAIYTYETGWQTNGLSWSAREDRPFRLVVGSFVARYENKVEIIEYDDAKKALVKRAGFDHPYPPTKVSFTPQSTPHTDLLVSSGDYLRVWEVRDGKPEGEPEESSINSTVGLRATLNNNKSSDFCAPVTSFDWNRENPSLLCSSSIDQTVSIWDLEAQTATTQVIAHDKDVYDVAFGKGTNVFASCSSDGSLRVFDLRQLEHCTIVYEDPNYRPLLRCGWNRLEPTYIATVGTESNTITIVDVRVPGTPVGQLTSHTGCVNSLQWAPHSAAHICSGGEDSQVLIWDVGDMPNPIGDPYLSYEAESEVNTICWSTQQTEWISIAFGNKVQILHV